MPSHNQIRSDFISIHQQDRRFKFVQSCVCGHIFGTNSTRASTGNGREISTADQSIPSINESHCEISQRKALCCITMYLYRKRARINRQTIDTRAHTTQNTDPQQRIFKTLLQVTHAEERSLYDRQFRFSGQLTGRFVDLIYPESQYVRGSPAAITLQ
jgi:hypothetical protein